MEAELSRRWLLPGRALTVGLLFDLRTAGVTGAGSRPVSPGRAVASGVLTVL